MIVKIQTQDLLLSQSIDILSAINGNPFAGFDKEFLHYLYKKHNEQEVTIDDSSMIDHVHSLYVYGEDGREVYCSECQVYHVLDESDEHTDRETVELYWKSFMERNADYVFEKKMKKSHYVSKTVFEENAIETIALEVSKLPCDSYEKFITQIYTEAKKQFPESNIQMIVNLADRLWLDGRSRDEA